jgi:hypothetical protein
MTRYAVKCTVVAVLAIALSVLGFSTSFAGASGGESFTFSVRNSILQTVAKADGGAQIPTAIRQALCSPKVEPIPKKINNVRGGVEYRVQLSSSRVAAIRRKGCTGNIEANYKHAVVLTDQAAKELNSAPTTTTIDPTNAYIAAYNALSTAVNAGIVNQNSDIPSTATAGIDAEITAYKAFDTSLSSIGFTGQARSDAQKVLNADAALEDLLGTLSVNTDNVENYNQVFSTVTPAEATVTADQTALNNDLGVSTSG